MHVYLFKVLYQSNDYKHKQHQIVLVKKVAFKHCVPFADCISEIKNTQIDNTKYIDVVMPMYNLIENSDNYSKNIKQLMAIHELALTDAGAFANTHADDNSASFKFKQKIIGVTDANGRKDVEIMVLLKYLSNI